MAIVRMDMGSYEIEREECVESGYGEMMELGWSPALQLQQLAVAGRQVAMPVHMVERDVEHFLRRMYASQR